MTGRRVEPGTGTELAETVGRLREQGQMVWLDELGRQLIVDGTLERLVGDGVGGVTVNPTTFDQAVSGSNLYDEDIRRLAADGWSEDRILWELLVQDVRAAADVLRPNYIDSACLDGYVSIEVSPDLAADTDATVAMARELWERCDHRNVLVKIPATDAGLPAIERSLASGINVNVTLTFSVPRYEQVVDAFLRGLEAREEAGQPLGGLASVASFFVSRVDAKVDKRLKSTVESAKQEENRSPVQAAERLLGRAGVANCWLAYRSWDRIFRGERWERLQRAGAAPQRCLWASTGVKDPAYPATKYADELARPDTIFTTPLSTLRSLHETKLAPPVADHPELIVDGLKELGIDLTSIGAELEAEGVRRFSDSYHHCLETLRGKVAGGGPT